MLVALAACGSTPSQHHADAPTADTLPDGQLDALVPSTEALDGLDVSFLFPLPNTAGDLDTLLALDDPGNAQPLLTRALFAQLPTIAESPGSDEYGAIRVVAARIDPCAPRAGGSCAIELRLIAQHIELDVHGLPMSHDGALHLLYEVSREQSWLARRVRELKSLRPTASADVLGPDPVLVAVGPDSAYAHALRSLIRDMASTSTLYRITEITMALGVEWDFLSFHVQGGVATREPIPELGVDTLQQVFDLSQPTTRVVALRPAPDAALAPVLDSTRWTTAADDEWRAAIAESLYLDNPHLAAVAATDCASCHVATRTRRAATAARPIDLSMLPQAFPPTSLDSGDQGGASPRAILAFSYVGRTPLVTDRTRNDTVRAADELNAVAW
jgi:hypothetical protein